MTSAEVTLAVFTFFNSLRFLAYVPQIAKAARDQSGAEAISFGTWGLFLASHASAMAYAIENQGDWKMASLFLSNALGCAAILAIAAWKRSRHRSRGTEGASAYAIEMPSRDRACGPRHRLPATTRWLAMAAGAVTLRSRACFRRLLAGLHESRRQQAAIERAKHRHLIFDPETGIHFGKSPAGQRAPPTE
jgi:hypothetical protein